MAWVTHNAPPDQRGRESGIVMGMLSAGSIAGPTARRLRVLGRHERPRSCASP